MNYLDLGWGGCIKGIQFYTLFFPKPTDVLNRQP